MSKILDIDSFIDCWKSFTEKNKTQFLDNYDSSDWTKLIVGEKKSTTNGSPFGDFFTEYFEKSYSYRKEDGLVDLSIFEKKNFIKGIFKIAKGAKGAKVSLDDCPTNYEVLIEHENDPAISHEEMYKLTTFRAALKVLITYIWDPSKSGDIWSHTHEKLSKNFESIIIQTNSKYPENVETNYILITGQRIGDKIVWKYTGFSVMNTLKQIDSFVIVHDWAKPNINE